MDMHLLLPELFLMLSFLLSAGLAAPAGETKSSARVRTKRCSCATFLDKECVYFCHLDIIWVNTPERVVSYGLGNAPRTKRSSPDPRCRCLREDDQTCSSFCQRERLHRYEMRTPGVSRSVSTDGCQHEPPADDVRSSNQESSPELRPAVQTRTLLEKWRMRRHHRARERDARSSAS